MRLISQRFHFSTLCVVFVISCAGLAGKLVYSSLSIDIPLEVGILTSVSGALFAFSTYALYRAFEIGPIRRVAPIIGALRLFRVLGSFYRGANKPDAMDCRDGCIRGRLCRGQYGNGGKS